MALTYTHHPWNLQYTYATLFLTSLPSLIPHLYSHHFHSSLFLSLSLSLSLSPLIHFKLISQSQSLASVYFLTLSIVALQTTWPVGCLLACARAVMACACRNGVGKENRAANSRVRSYYYECGGWGWGGGLNQVPTRCCRVNERAPVKCSEVPPHTQALTQNNNYYF